MTKVISLTKAKVNYYLDEIVKEVGVGYVYEMKEYKNADGETGNTCVYVWKRKADCLIGRVLHRAGVTLKELSKHENEPASNIIEGMEEAGTMVAEPGVSLLLMDIQSNQDHGVPWGKAVRDGRKGVRSW